MPPNRHFTKLILAQEVTKYLKIFVLYQSNNLINQMPARIINPNHGLAVHNWVKISAAFNNFQER